MQVKSFKKYFIPLLSITSILALLMLCYGLYQVAYHVPDDYLQGQYVKIMYIHVPSAWLSLLIYGIIGLFSGLFLITYSPFYSMVARSCALTGMSFAFITLVTGSIWGKPTWGTYWVWDARLTSMLIMFFLYIGYKEVIIIS